MNPLSSEGVTTTTDLASAAVLRSPLHLDLADASVGDLTDAVAMERFRHLPEWRELSFAFHIDVDLLLPEDASVVVNLRTRQMTQIVAEGPGFVVHLKSWPGSSNVFVAAMTAADADGIAEAINSRVERPTASDSVPITLWRLQHGHARSWRRELQVPEWSTVARNYPSRTALETLMALRSVSGTGRLMLWTGPPGTGKTYAIRALAQAWGSWCSSHLVIDPEHFFGDAGYLMDVMMQGKHDDEEDEDEKAGQGPRARLIICEDADDFLRARELTGGGLGRLLNVADGLLGQGLNNIILLTSNTPVARLDPALTRPGRMLANLEFRAFTPVEARAWLGAADVAVPEPGATLAELYEITGATARHIDAPIQVPPTGAYL